MKFFKVSRSRLNGIVKVSGAKNSVLRLLAASILTKGDVKILNFPSDLLDAQIHLQMLKKLGKEITSLNDSVQIKENEAPASKLEWNDRSIRNTLLILGAMVARIGEGAVPLPGGCKLGERKYDLHVMLLEKLGAEVWEENNMLLARAPLGLSGTDIHLPIRSTGATENSIICGCLAKGTTRIWNPHIRPEVLDLIDFLKKMGAIIRVYGQSYIEIVGVEGLNGVTHSVISDNMEAITWVAGAVMTNGDIEILDFPFDDLEVVMIHLKASGAKCYRFEDRLIVRGGTCYPLEISTGPHPGINSDVQPILAAYAANAHGKSRIVDLRFPGRYAYAEQMRKMGLDYSIEGNLLNIYGNGGGFKGARVKALDLRAGAALLLSGLTADGETVIDDAWQIERGYNQILSKLKALGANVDMSNETDLFAKGADGQ